MSYFQNIKSLQHKSYLVLVLVLGLLLSACSKPELQPLEADDKILAFGDSLTAGYGVKKTHSYPAVLSQILNRPVINAGISGETTAEGLQRFTEVLNEHSPKLVILMEGGNDFLRNIPAGKTLENLRFMILEAKSRNIDVLLIGVPPKKLFAGSHELFDTLADEFEIPLEDEIIPSLMLRPSMKSDYVHFNENGYRLLAQTLAEKMKDFGAID